MSSAALVALVLIGLAAAGPAHGQTQYQQVISANPFGLLLELFNGEYERVVSESATAGVGGSYFTSDDNDYTNADVFFRYYPQGTPLDGWAFGAKLGVTGVSEGTYFGYGFDANRSWLIGRNHNFYVGIGFGLKRLVGVDTDTDEELLRYIPTFRIVNIGFAF